jgi:lysozyme family protein
VVGLPDTTHAVTDEVLRAVAKRDPKALVIAINDERRRFLKGLKTWPVFGAGWGRRVAEVKAFSLQFAERPITPRVPAPHPSEAAPTKGMVPVPKGLQKVTTVTGAASGGVAATTLHGAGHDLWIIIAAMGGIILIAGLGWVAFHWWQQNRQEAPTPGFEPVPAQQGRMP